jgi:hypothetical protein
MPGYSLSYGHNKRGNVMDYSIGCQGLKKYIFRLLVSHARVINLVKSIKYI